MQWFLAVASLWLADSAPDVERDVRSYDIRFLVDAVPQFPAPIWPSAGGLALGSSPGIVEPFSGAPISFTVEAAEGVMLSAESIVGLIRQNIAEDSWANERNSIEARDGELVVVQVPGVLDEISRLLARLRSRRARMFAIDLALVPAEALVGDILESGPWLSEAAFVTVLQRAGEKAHRASLMAYNEQTVSGLSGRRRATVLDTEVNQTGVVPVVNPVVQTLPIGVSLEVRPLAIAPTDWVRLELQLARLAEAGDAKTRRTFFADIEFVPLREMSIDTTLLVDSGRAALAGYFRDSLARGKARDYAVLARLRRVDLEADAPPERPPPERFYLRVHDVGFLLGDPERRESVLDEKLLVEIVRSNVSPETWRDDRARISVEDGRFLYVTAPRDAHRALERWIDERVSERAALATVEARVFEGPLDVLLKVRKTAQAGLVLPDNWRQSDPGRALIETLRAIAVGTMSTRIRARGFDARTYVSDVETVSGGTGFSLLEMADPVVLSAGRGFSLEARVDPLPGSDRLRLELTLKRCKTEFERNAEFLAASAVGRSRLPPRAPPRSEKTTPSESPGGDALPSTVYLPYLIDLPRQESLNCRTSAAVSAGKPVILKLERSREGAGRMVVVTVQRSYALERR